MWRQATGQMRQVTLASQGTFEPHSKKTRREKFLEEMDGIMPWTELESLIEPYYPKEGKGRRRWDRASCYASTFSSTGSICRIRLPKKR